MSELPELFSTLVRFETELWNAVDVRLRAEHDLPLSRYQPMQVIARRASCRVFDIADELSITVGGTSKLIDRIEESGFCRRKPNPDDKRSSLIQLTPAGRRILLKAAATVEKELAIRLGSSVSGQSLQRFASTLVKLRAANAVVDGRDVVLSA